MSTPRPKSATAGRVVPERKAEPYRTYIGIDPGITGAVAIFGNTDLAPWVCSVPTRKTSKGRRELDREILAKMLGAFTGRRAVIEKVNAAPMRGRLQGTTSMFSFGLGYGLWLGILQTLEIPYIEVDPRKWKRAILGGTPKDKAAAIGYVQRFYPTVDLKVTPRCRTLSDGKADAICIAEYARREWRTRELLEQRS